MTQSQLWCNDHINLDIELYNGDNIDSGIYHYRCYLEAPQP